MNKGLVTSTYIHTYTHTHTNTHTHTYTRICMNTGLGRRFRQWRMVSDEQRFSHLYIHTYTHTHTNTHTYIYTYMHEYRTGKEIPTVAYGR
jgi:hypothetical protein